MPGNPQIPQGQLNRIKGAIQFDNFPALDISASYLGPEMIGLQLQGDVTSQLPSSTGVVRSPEPYQIARVMVDLLRSQGLGALFKAQLENLSVIGNFTIYPDTTVEGYTYTITNGAIVTAEPGRFDGRNTAWTLTLGGTYLVNQGLWS